MAKSGFQINQLFRQDSFTVPSCEQTKQLKLKAHSPGPVNLKTNHCLINIPVLSQMNQVTVQANGSGPT